MTNVEIAETLELFADLLEFQGANPFRVRSYRTSARAIRELHEPLADIYADDPKRLRTIPGIGESMAAKCETLLKTGELPQLNELRQQIPESVLALARIPGVGPKKAAALHRELGVTTLEELEAACRADRVRTLKGFGAKTQQAILDNLKSAAAPSQRIYWADADVLARALVDFLSSCLDVERVEAAGSYRRGRETVGDIDLLAITHDPAAVMERFAQYPTVQEVLARGDTKMSVRTSLGLQIDLRVVPAESFGAALQYFTGSKEHNVELRGRAKQRGLKVNEYGVFQITDEGERYVAGATEEEVYEALGLPWFPPELREGRQEFKWADEGRLPELVELADIIGDLHMHTNETDGKATLEEMIAACRARGLKYIAITDHSQRVSMARGLNPDRLRAQWKRIDELRKQLDDDFIVLKGIECDILEKGGMDLPDDVLAEADWVLASVHYGQKQSRQQITERILEAIEHPYVSAIAHPTGRLINRRDPYDVDLDAVFRAAQKHRKLLELNANPARLDLNDIHCAIAQQYGIPIVINTDAHSVDQLDMMRYGVIQARRGGLEREHVANTRSWPELRALIGRG